LGALLVLAGGCTGAPPAAGPDPGAWTPAQRAQAEALEASLAADPPAPPGSLRVRLAFGAAADLDLYVSDPAKETVYYANTPSKSGGALEADRRCAHPAPRVERVRFDAPPPGGYRVGVDAPRRCGEDAEGGDPVVYVVAVERPGRPLLLRRGRITPVRFDPVVVELDLEAD
ncbi:MAG: PPC domain-containing protein, partial [Thermoanaerobaculia bacterium]|nr:PPC domain-containing protein [Thermoanaerobaculia bacterium]